MEIFNFFSDYKLIKDRLQKIKKQTDMKKISLIALLTLVITGISFQSTAQDSKAPQTVIIRMSEFSAQVESSIITVHPDGTSDSQKISQTPPKHYEINAPKNTLILHKEINKWKLKGFIIDGISNSNSDFMITTIVILSKE